MIDKILAPTDYTEESLAACNLALSFGAQFGAPVEIVHIWSAPYFGPEYDQGAPGPHHQSLFDLIRQRAEEEMKAFVDKLDRPEGVKVVSRVESGETIATILEHVKTDKPSLVVVGTHGRTGAKYLLLGSIASRLVQLCPCPVLTVPHRREKAS